jgi:hypothetical protein
MKKKETVYNVSHNFVACLAGRCWSSERLFPQRVRVHSMYAPLADKPCTPVTLNTFTRHAPRNLSKCAIPPVLFMFGVSCRLRKEFAAALLVSSKICGLLAAYVASARDGRPLTNFFRFLHGNRNGGTKRNTASSHLVFF